VPDESSELSEQVAAARALSNLAHELIAATGEEVEAFERDAGALLV
jgi:hypothetical protein